MYIEILQVSGYLRGQRKHDRFLQLTPTSCPLVAIVSSTSSSLEATQTLERLARVRALVASSPSLWYIQWRVRFDSVNFSQLYY